VTAVRVSAKTDYALRALLVLAEQAPALVKVEALTAAEGMPRKFVELILSELRRAGLVVSRRGSDGGYGLALPPERITVGAVVRLLDGPLNEGAASRPSAGVHGSAVHLTDVWTAATVSVSNVLDGTTLAHVLTGHLPEHVTQLAAAGSRRADLSFRTADRVGTTDRPSVATAQPPRRISSGGPA
jgi:Rrf2 family protein